MSEGQLMIIEEFKERIKTLEREAAHLRETLLIMRTQQKEDYARADEAELRIECAKTTLNSHSSRHSGAAHCELCRLIDLVLTDLNGPLI